MFGRSESKLRRLVKSLLLAVNVLYQYDDPAGGGGNTFLAKVNRAYAGQGKGPIGNATDTDGDGTTDIQEIKTAAEAAFKAMWPAANVSFGTAGGTIITFLNVPSGPGTVGTAPGPGGTIAAPTGIDARNSSFTDTVHVFPRTYGLVAWPFTATATQTSTQVFGNSMGNTAAHEFGHSTGLHHYFAANGPNAAKTYLLTPSTNPALHVKVGAFTLNEQNKGS